MATQQRERNPKSRHKSHRLTPSHRQGPIKNIKQGQEDTGISLWRRIRNRHHSYIREVSGRGWLRKKDGSGRGRGKGKSKYCKRQLAFGGSLGQARTY